MDLRVECYEGHRGQETPRRFFLGGRWVEVAEVVDRWIGPDHRYFKVRGDDGAVSILRHDTAGDSWDLTLFEARSRSSDRTERFSSKRSPRCER
jgi:hypothetical protein